LGGEPEVHFAGKRFGAMFIVNARAPLNNAPFALRVKVIAFHFSRLR
jgi:hypothetical protein